MKIPEIGDIVGNDLAVELCNHYQFGEIVSRIEASPEQFKEWKFDGASMLPDGLVSRMIDIEQEIFSEVALKHDLKYAYGVPGDTHAKQRADKEFEQDLIQINVHGFLARRMFLMVDHFGGEEWGTTYSWGFAHVDS